MQFQTHLYNLHTYTFTHAQSNLYFKYRPYHICDKKGASKRNHRDHCQLSWQ